MSDTIYINGIKGKDFPVDPNDKQALKMAMLFEGHCTIGVQEAIKKYGYTEQRYYQLLSQYKKGGSDAIRDKKRGSEKQPVRTQDVVSQIIRMRFLDPLTSVEVITQKLNQMGYNVSVRSVERTITDYGLQKKHMFKIR
jgi:transposase